MWREIEPGFWQRRDNGWSVRAASQEEAEAAYQRRIAEQERQRQLEQELRNTHAMELPEFTPVLSGFRRKINQNNFKLPIDNLRDMHLRLANSVIFVGPEPVYVADIVEHRNEFWLVFDTAEEKRFRLSYNNPKVDCRSAEPQYLVYDHSPQFLLRYPARHQKQGMDSQNVVLKTVGGSTHKINSYIELCRSLKEINDLSWSPQYFDLMTKAKAFRSLRLSSDIAVYADKNLLRVEFRGRELGQLNDDTITADELDASRPWIQDAVHKIGCELK